MKDYFLLSFTSDDGLYKTFFSFANGFLYRGERHIKFSQLLKDNTVTQAKIQPLLQDGKPFQRLSIQKKKMPPYCKISDAFLIREDLFCVKPFEHIKGITFIDIEVDGVFPQKYKLLSFSNVLNCIDIKRSVRSEIDFFSKLVLNKSEIPATLNGFFLSGWDLFGGVNYIVDNELKDNLITLDQLSSFFIFEKL